MNMICGRACFILICVKITLMKYFSICCKSIWFIANRSSVNPKLQISSIRILLKVDLIFMFTPFSKLWTWFTVQIWIFPVGIYLFKAIHQNNVWNLFKVSNKNTRTTSMTPFWCFYCSLWTGFTHCTGISN